MSKTKTIIFSALFAAITAISAQITIPIAPIPLNTALIAVILSGIVLGKSCGMISQIIYLAVGAIGIPVFAGMQGGLSVIIGPTGGFLIGYVLASYAAGFVVSKMKKQFLSYIFASLSALLLCYLCGTAWFMMVTKNDVISSLAVCVLPFIAVDIFKIFVVSLVAAALYKRKAFVGW